VEIVDNGRSLAFTPAEDFFGTVTFTYTVFDEVRGEQTATVTVNVENVPDDRTRPTTSSRWSRQHGRYARRAGQRR